MLVDDDHIHSWVWLVEQLCGFFNSGVAAKLAGLAGKVPAIGAGIDYL